MSAHHAATCSGPQARQRDQSVDGAHAWQAHPVRLAPARVWPIVRFPATRLVVTRYDDVREVFLNDQAFRVPYNAKSRRHHGRGALLPRHGRHVRLSRRRRRDAQVVRPADIAQRLVPAVERWPNRSSPDAGGSSRWSTRWCAGSPSRCSATISACPIRRAATCASGRPGCSNSSSPIGPTIRRCGPKSMSCPAPCVRTSRISMDQRRASGPSGRTMFWGAASRCRPRATPGFDDDRSASP